MLEGQCEFLVEEERVTCGPGQLIYVEPQLKHTLHAVGTEPCVIYLSVTPHVEPTHTQYDEGYRPLPPRYGTWRGTGHTDTSADVATPDLAGRYVAAARQLAERAGGNADAAEGRLAALQATAADQPALKAIVDELWLDLRDVLQLVHALEHDWNALAPRAMPTTLQIGGRGCSARSRDRGTAR